MDNGPSRLYGSLLTARLTIVVHIFCSFITTFVASTNSARMKLRTVIYTLLLATLCMGCGGHGHSMPSCARRPTTSATYRSPPTPSSATPPPIIIGIGRATALPWHGTPWAACIPSRTMMLPPSVRTSVLKRSSPILRCYIISYAIRTLGGIT